MGAFYLIRPAALADADATRARLGAAFRRQGFGEPAVARGPGWEIGLYGRLGGGAPIRAQTADGRRAYCAGTLFYRGRHGAAALAALADDDARGRIDHDRLHGSFAVAVEAADGLRLFTDRTGTLHVFAGADGAVLSTSFLALAAALPRLTLDTDGVYDYLLQEAPHGGNTLFTEIRLLDSARLLVIGADGLAERPLPPVEPAPLPAGASLDDLARHCLAPLRAQANDYAAAFAQRIDTALSGGFDSRLILALLREQGVVPRLHVYGRAGDADVRVAQAVAAGERLTLAHADKDRVPVVPPEAFAEVVAANLQAFDGCPNDGLFNNGADLATRRERCAGGELMLNGGGGEIFRNFFYLPDRPMPARHLVWAFYGRFDPAALGPRFDEGAYVEGLAVRIARAVGGDPARLSRREVELAYPLFRCRFWMGRNNGVNNRLGAAVTPFCTPAAVQAAAAVPLAAKNAGRLEARMIALTDPALAGYPSVYGFPFDRPPPLKYRLKDTATRVRPPWLRRYTYRLKHRRPPALPLHLTGPYTRAVLGDGFDHVRPFLDPAQVRDAAMYNRLCSLEALCQSLGGTVQS